MVTGCLVGIITMKYVPFFEKINEVHNYVNSLPRYSSFRLNIPGIDISLTDFIDYVNEAIKHTTEALDMVQVGIGWIVPIQHYRRLVDQQKLK